MPRSTAPSESTPSQSSRAARAQRVAASVFAGAALFVAGFVVTGILPVVASIGAVAAIGCAGATLTVPPRTAVRLQMALSYVFAGALFAALCGRYCAGWGCGEPADSPLNDRPGSVRFRQ